LANEFKKLKELNLPKIAFVAHHFSYKKFWQQKN
jgi:hypothetical protein